MRAFGANKPGGDPCLALTIFDNALEVLDWGRTGAWKDVSIQDKSIVFASRTTLCVLCAICDWKLSWLYVGALC